MAKDIAELIKEATEAVEGVPEDLRAVAFQKAFDVLAGVHNGGGAPTASPANRGRGSAIGGNRQRPKANGDSSRSQLDSLDRTAYPEITEDASGLANSLRVLKAAHDELSIDGLSASDIAHVLTDKFRCKISRQAVSMALNDAGRYVNRHKDGNSVLFQIMSGGENYLDKLGSDKASEPVKFKTKRPKSTKNAKVTKKTANSVSSSAETATKKKATKRKSKANSTKTKPKTPGKKALLMEMIADGFFNKPKVLQQIIDELKHKYGRTFKPNEMSTPMLRLLRDKTLAREMNSDNQYEYKNA